MILRTRPRHVEREAPPASRPSQLTGEQAFEEYVLPEVDTLYRVALSLTRNHADAEDLVQDALVRAFRSIDGFDGRHPRAWLFTILRNTNINRQRRRRPELLHDPDTTMARLESTEPAGGNVEDRVVDQTFDSMVEASLQALSPKYRQVVELVDLDGLTYEEAAGTLGVPVGTVMSRLHRAQEMTLREDTLANLRAFATQLASGQDLPSRSSAGGGSPVHGT